MEYALRGMNNFRILQVEQVLILVLMEYALRAKIEIPFGLFKSGLNPCSNGICSTRAKKIYNPHSQVLKYI